MVNVNVWKDIMTKTRQNAHNVTIPASNALKTLIIVQNVMKLHSEFYKMDFVIVWKDILIKLKKHVRNVVINV